MNNSTTQSIFPDLHSKCIITQIEDAACQFWAENGNVPIIIQLGSKEYFELNSILKSISDDKENFVNVTSLTTDCGTSVKIELVKTPSHIGAKEGPKCLPV